MQCYQAIKTLWADHGWPRHFSNILKMFVKTGLKSVWTDPGIFQKCPDVSQEFPFFSKDSRFVWHTDPLNLKPGTQWQLEQCLRPNRWGGNEHPPSMPSDDIHLNRLKIEGQSCWAENDSTDSQLVMDYFLKRKKSECAHHPHLNLLIPAPHCSRLDLEPFYEIVMVLITM